MLAMQWRMTFTLSVAGLSALVGHEGSPSPCRAIAMPVSIAYVSAESGSSSKSPFYR